VHDGKVYVGGSFTTAGGVTANRVAVWDIATQVWSRLETGSGNGVNNTVSALAVHDGKVYVGGSFTTAGGVTANRVAVWDIATQVWSTLGTGSGNGVNSTVGSLAVHNGKVYAGGRFTTAGGAPANRVAVWDIATQVWSSLGTGSANGVGGLSTSQVLALAVHGGKVYVGGAFTTAGGVTANRVAVWDIATQAWSSVGSGSANGVSSTVYTLAIHDEQRYVGGAFTTAGGVVTNRIARWSCPSGLAPMTALPPVTGRPELGLGDAVPSGEPRWLQAAIDAAADGAVIRLPPGTYTGAIRIAGKAITIESIAGAAVTIIDGGRLVDTVISVVEGGYLHLRGVTVQGGVGGTAMSGVADVVGGVGGGVLIAAGHAIIESCVIRGNSAVHGGGIAAIDSLLQVADSIVALNGAAGVGGGVFVFASNASLESSRVLLNHAEAHGAMWACEDSAVSIVASELCWNEPIDPDETGVACGACAADLNGDGMVDVSDLAAWLESWDGRTMVGAAGGRPPAFHGLAAVLAAWGWECVE
jgi:hypothetical protein